MNTDPVWCYEHGCDIFKCRDEEHVFPEDLNVPDDFRVDYDPVKFSPQKIARRPGDWVKHTEVDENGNVNHWVEKVKGDPAPEPGPDRELLAAFNAACVILLIGAAVAAAVVILGGK